MELFLMSSAVLLSMMGLYMGRCVYLLPLRPKHFIHGICRALKASNGDGITPYEAFSAALGGCVGTGNIAGVAGAIAIGGPGAIFWLWISGILGMATKYAEALIAIRYRPGGGKDNAGGTMYCIVLGMGRGAWPLAAAFSVFALLASLACGNIVQSNTLALAAASAAGALGFGEHIGLVKLMAGIITAALIYIVLRGGAKGICSAAGKIVPVMSAVYIIAAAAVIYMFRAKLPEVLKMIMDGAFGLKSIAGGAAGFTMAQGIRVGMMRGIFSNEAGIGSATMAYSSPKNGADEAETAMLAAFDVFIDTIVICTLTAFTVLCAADYIPYGYAEADGMAICLSAFSKLMGSGAAGVFLAVSSALFAFSSMITWAMYGERALCFLSHDRGQGIYRICFAVICLIGSLSMPGIVWSMGEVFNALMALPNIIMLIALSGEIKRASKHYLAWRGRI